MTGDTGGHQWLTYSEANIFFWCHWQNDFVLFNSMKFAADVGKIWNINLYGRGYNVIAHWNQLGGFTGQIAKGPLGNGSRSPFTILDSFTR